MQVAEGKTEASHAYDQIYLLAEEFRWFQEWGKLRTTRHATRSPYMMVTAGEGEARSLNKYTDYYFLYD